ncbi:MAG: RsbRD N-terminal domain-containing protein [Nitrospirota bacterium]
MNLINLLSSKKSAILKRWFDEIVSTYPDATSSFLKTQDDPFANPVGQTILHGIDGLFDELLKDTDSNEMPSFLDNIIRIRAVQGFTPSQSTAFTIFLKKVIREELKDEIKEDQLYNDLAALEARIDKMALLSFDIYMKCRETLYEIKANEVKNMTFNLLRRANMLSEVQEE